MTNMDRWQNKDANKIGSRLDGKICRCFPYTVLGVTNVTP